MSFSTTNAIKTVLRRFTLISSSSSRKRNGSVSLSVTIPHEPERNIDTATTNSAPDAYDETSSDSTYDSDSLMETDTADTAGLVDTPLSWCCRGNDDDGTAAEQYKSSNDDDDKIDCAASSLLLDSQVYIFKNIPDSDLDFSCIGEPERFTATTTFRRRWSRPRRWSAPYLLPSITTTHTSGNNKAAESSPPATKNIPWPGFKEEEEVAVAEEDLSFKKSGEAGAGGIVKSRLKKRPAPLKLQPHVPNLGICALGGGVASHCASNKWGNQPPEGYI